MRMSIAAASGLILLVLARTSGAMGLVGPTVQHYTLAVEAGMHSKQPAYTADVDVLDFGSGYHAQLAYLGRPSVGGGQFPQGDASRAQTTSVANSPKPAVYPEGIVSLVSAHPHDTVINGGFSGADPGTPAGLLLIGGSVVSPLSFQRSAKGGKYQLSAILCFDPQGKISVTPTAAAASATSTVIKACNSALQAGPFVVDQGANGISSSEMRSTPFRRTIVGWDRAGNLTVVLFKGPINLYAAGEFLRAPRSTGQHFILYSVDLRGLSQSRADRPLGSGDGLGLVEAVNLDGDQDSIAVFAGRIITGDVYRKIPSAIVIVPTTQ